MTQQQHPTSSVARLRETRAKIEARYPHDGSFNLEVSTCCQALFLSWYSEKSGNGEQSCTACGEICTMSGFDYLGERLP